MNKFNDTYRPQYHYSAPENWINDPNGLVFFDGEYHLFCQHNPFANHWGPMYWGHAVSNDMLHWKHLPIALEPDEFGTIFSGCCVVDYEDCSGLFDGKPGLVAIYTAHKDVENKHPIETQCLAYSKDKGRTWIKYENNPIMTPPNTPDAYDYRDPKIIYDKDKKEWLMALGGGFYRFYKSKDLINWNLICETKIFEEFPDIAYLDVENEPGKKYLLIAEAGFRYMLAHFEGNELIVDQGELKADYAEGCQAAQTFFNITDGRTIWMAWLRDGSRGPTSPWRCSYSIPKELKLLKMKDGSIRLIQEPIKELDSLCKNIFSLKDSKVTKYTNVLENVKGRHLDIRVAVKDLENVNVLNLKLFKDENGRHTLVRFDFKQHMMFVDYTGALDPQYDDLQTSFPDYTCPEPIKVRGTCYNAYFEKPEELSFRVLLDRSSVEVFVKDTDLEFSYCCYPRECADGLELTSDGDYTVKQLDVYEVESVWEE